MITCIAAGLFLHRLCDTPYGRISPRGALLLEIMELTRFDLFSEGEPLSQSRRKRNASGFLGGCGARLEEVRSLAIPVPAGAIPARLYLPSRDPHLPIVVYFHGGGWFLGNLETHDHICRNIARASGAAVLSPAFRLAPEHPFPAAVEDALAVLAWVHDNAGALGCDARRIAVAGDSSGGNLAAAAALVARDAGGPPIACQALLYPVTDVSRMDTVSYRDFAEGYYLTKRYMEIFRSMYVPDRRLWSDPRVSPLLARSLSGLPPAVMVTAQFDVLRDEGEAYAARLAAAGVPVVHRRFDGTIHGFVGMDRVFPQSREAISMIAGELRRVFSRRGNPGAP
ncbi:MAG: alpha/beta hydrolase [Spirochaetes bacterium]|nr:alpha/beta hydrolase [Spirochaetota bacterium]